VLTHNVGIVDTSGDSGNLLYLIELGSTSLVIESLDVRLFDVLEQRAIFLDTYIVAVLGINFCGTLLALSLW
jgi:hypothetical protein